jgi:hypothetical protein
VVVTQHGGTYAIKDNTFYETVEYGSPECINLIGHTFKFKIKLQADTLTKAGIDNPWNDVWKRVN